MSELESIPVDTIRGEQASLGDHAGKVRLVVNVASKCGLTPQYEGLEALQRKYADQGFSVLGFPANDFGQQEPGSNEEIQQFCTTNFGVDFPMFSKIAVTGPDKHPLYKALTEAKPEANASGDDFRERLRGFGMTPTAAPEVLWNFEKFVVGRDGEVKARFLPSTTPDDPELVATIESELAK